MRKGFIVCDTAFNGMELLVKKYKNDTPIPKFTDSARNCMIEDEQNLTFFYSDMCPFVPVYVLEMKEAAENRGFSCKMIKFESLLDRLKNR